MNLEQRAATLYPGHVRYQTAWVKMIQLLGERWLLAHPINRNPQ